MTSRRLLAICVLLAGLFGPAPIAGAQAELRQDLIVATELSPEQVQEITVFARQWLPGLASDDPEQIKRSRDRLLDPAKQRNASVRFRQAYSRILLDGGDAAEGLTKLAAGDRDRAVINALLLAGEVATSDSARLLVNLLNDKRPAVRFAALAGLARLFAAIQQAATNPAIGSADVVNLVNRAGQQVETEQNGRVLDAGVRALIEALKVTRDGYKEVRQVAVSNLCDKCAVRAAAAKRVDPEELSALLRAAVAVRDALSENNPNLSLSPQGVAAAANLAGHLLSYTIRNRKDFDQDPALRDEGATLVQVAEAIISVAVPKLKSGAIYNDSHMAEDFRSPAGETAFVRKASEALGVLQGLGLGPFLKDR